jgi:hypothetical protein
MKGLPHLLGGKMSFLGLKKSHKDPHSLNTSGNVGIQVIRASEGPKDINELINEYAMPHANLDEEVRRYRSMNWQNIMRGWNHIKIAHNNKIPTFYGTLWGQVTSNGETLDLGIISMRVVTTAGVAAIVDAFQNTFELETFKYHAIGTGTGSESSADTALGTELTTEYETNNTRPTGTTTEGASSNIYRSVATNTVDASVAITEHGIFNQASNAGGTLLDRSVFSVVNLASNDSLQTTYDLTFSSGG